MKSTKVLAALVATMAVGATCAFAANPFVDVPSDSWAYKSVVELADAGIIQGVDGTYFQGERNITRYEAAEMTAKAMAHMDKASVEQRALINKLADEYADELNNLGVRVSALENKVGNVKLSGDARVRFQTQNADRVRNDEGMKNDSSWDYRVRLRADAQVNDRTKVLFGVSTGDINFADNSAASDGDNIFVDDAKIDYNFGGDTWNLSVGRTDTYILGGENAYGYQYGDVFDRAELTYTNDKFRATAGYGKFKEGDLAGNDDDGLDGVKTGYGELEGFFGGGRAAGSAIGVYYNDFTRSGGVNTGDKLNADDLWGAYASVNFGKWNALANYEHVKNDAKDVDDADIWIGKLTYGGADAEAPGSWDAWVEYLSAEKDGYLFGATNSWRSDSLLDNVESWGIGADYTIQKNLVLTVAQSFGSKTKDGDMSDPKEMTDVELNFFF